MTRNDAGKHLKIMTNGVIGVAKYIGILSDLQIHGREIPGEDLIKWTGCQNEAGISF